MMHMKIDGRIYDADAIREMEAQAEYAAAEIARLRAEVERQKAKGRRWLQDIQLANRASNEAEEKARRLRAELGAVKAEARAKALEDAAKVADYYASGSPTAISIAIAIRIRAMIEQEDKG